jgi:hypothetical protein
MSETTEAEAFQDALGDAFSWSRGGDVIRVAGAPGSAVGTPLHRWLDSIADDRGAVPNCGHAVQGKPAVIVVDDDHPVIRCVQCSIGYEHPADDGICHLCGRASVYFTAFICNLGPLTIMGHCCPACEPEMPGRVGGKGE